MGRSAETEVRVNPPLDMLGGGGAVGCEGASTLWSWGAPILMRTKAAMANIPKDAMPIEGVFTDLLPQLAMMVVVSILPRMNPPGFQIGVIGWAIPAVFQQRDMSPMRPRCCRGT